VTSLPPRSSSPKDSSVPAGSGLVAEARGIKQGRRAGFYQVSVPRVGGALVAQVHCVAYTLPASGVLAEEWLT
jgi:acyl-coenzyme A thioesterase PaaI-like protein